MGRTAARRDPHAPVARWIARRITTAERCLFVGSESYERLRTTLPGDDLSVHRVIIEPNEALPQITMDFVREAKATNVRVSLLPRILEVFDSTIEVDDLGGLTLLGVPRPACHGPRG